MNSADSSQYAAASRPLTEQGVWFPPNLRFLLTPDDDPDLAVVDQIEGLDVLDDEERRARIAAVLRAS